MIKITVEGLQVFESLILTADDAALSYLLVVWAEYRG